MRNEEYRGVFREGEAKYAAFRILNRDWALRTFGNRVNRHVARTFSTDGSGDHDMLARNQIGLRVRRFHR